MLSVMMHPAEPVGRNEMPFSRYTGVLPRNIVLDGSQKGRLWVGTPSLQHCHLPPIARLFWPLLHINTGVISYAKKLVIDQVVDQVGDMEFGLKFHFSDLICDLVYDQFCDQVCNQVSGRKKSETRSMTRSATC